MMAKLGENHRPGGAGVACEDCGLYGLCLPLGLEQPERARLNQIIIRRRPLEEGDYLIRARQPLRAIFAIRSGSMKTCIMIEAGVEQITGFRLPAEILGLDAVAGGYHRFCAVALEKTWVCEMPFESTQALARKLPQLHGQMLRIMSNELWHAEHFATLQRSRGAAANLAALLLGLSERYCRLGFSATRFRLSMSRSDIANYLGVTIETVSRLLARFQEDGLLSARRRHVHLRDLSLLRAMAGMPVAGADGS